MQRFFLLEIISSKLNLAHKFLKGGEMAQHFLLSKEARGISGSKMLLLSKERVIKLLTKIRWADNGGKPVCPKCKNNKKNYFLKTTKRFKCPQCSHHFSVASGTILQDHKIPLKYYLAAMGFFVNASKGINAIFLSKELGVEHKTAWVILQKIRQVLEKNDWETPFEGECEIDRVYYGHYIKPKNRRSNRLDRRKITKDTKVAVLSIRQRVSDEERARGLLGSFKTKTFLIKSENSSIINKIVYKHIKEGSIIHTDENKAYNDLDTRYDYILCRVNHKDEYMGFFGENNNQCESYNARIRRAFYGVYHRSNVMYMARYASEMAYREDTRRTPSKKVFFDLLSRCLNSPPSGEFAGYWQGNKRINSNLNEY